MSSPYGTIPYHTYHTRYVGVVHLMTKRIKKSGDHSRLGSLFLLMRLLWFAPKSLLTINIIIINTASPP